MTETLPVWCNQQLRSMGRTDTQRDIANTRKIQPWANSLNSFNITDKFDFKKILPTHHQT